MNALQFLRKPYPHSLNRWRITILISLFISAFMVIFQPFGLQNFSSEHKTLILAGYGLVTFIILFLNLIVLPALSPKFLNDDGWTVFKEILWMVWIVAAISAGNYLYSSLFSVVAWVGINGFIYFLLFTLLIALIPITGLTILSYNRMLRKNLALSLEMNSLISGLPADRKDDKEIILASENQGQVVRTSLSNLISIESEGNYVNILHLTEGRLTQTLVRITLKKIEQQIQGTDHLFKCHRAFIINLPFVEKVKGNSQGYQLKMKYLDHEIPVARSYSKSFKEGMSMLK